MLSFRLQEVFTLYLGRQTDNDLQSVHRHFLFLIRVFMKKCCFYSCLLAIASCSSQEPKNEPVVVAFPAGQGRSENRVVSKPNINLISALQNANAGSVENTRELVDEYRREFFEITDVEAKCDLLVAIAELDSINTADFFIRALADPEPGIRREAAIQMKQMVIHPDVRDALFAALDDADDDVLIEVIEAVSEIREKRMQDKLREISASHSDQLIRDVALDYANRMSEGE